MEQTSANKTVQGKSCTKSPNGPVMMRVIGKNIPEMAKVANDMGTNSVLMLLNAEYQRE